ncbi:hypothetical protein HDU99_009390 [Rhizoclosmatium hyalinum]|nr:hypothetical protein HDU99_009390 [Rhizoclosmatium hyalinum]
MTHSKTETVHVRATVLADIFATGTAAGLITELCLYPIEHPDPLRRFNRVSALNMLKVAASRAPSTGLLMSCYEFARIGITNNVFPSSTHPFLTPLLSGFLAVCAESLVLAPLVALKETPISRTQMYSKPLLLFKPAPTIIATTAPFVALYYSLSDLCIARLKKSPSFTDKPSWLVSALGGAMGGSLAILGAAPIEVLRVQWINHYNNNNNTLAASSSSVASLPSQPDVKWKLTHQSPRFAFRRAFFGILKQTVTKRVGAVSVGAMGRASVTGFGGLVRRAVSLEGRGFMRNVLSGLSKRAMAFEMRGMLRGFVQRVGTVEVKKVMTGFMRAMFRK